MDYWLTVLSQPCTYVHAYIGLHTLVDTYRQIYIDTIAYVQTYRRRYRHNATCILVWLRTHCFINSYMYIHLCMHTFEANELAKVAQNEFCHTKVPVHLPLLVKTSILVELVQK